MEDARAKKPFGGSNPSNRKTEKNSAKSTNPFGDSDDDENVPEASLSDTAVLEQMEKTWRELQDLMTTALSDPFTLQEFQDHLTAVVTLMMKDQSFPSDKVSDSVQLLLTENVLEKLYLYVTRQKAYSRESRLLLLKFTNTLLSLPGQPLLIHQQIVRPLGRLLRVCETSPEQNLSIGLVPLLQRICLLIQETDTLLDLFFSDGAGQTPSKFFVFTQLVPHIHDNSETGRRARDAILICLSVAARSLHSNLGEFIVADTNFCQVLGTGLSALYSSLPTEVELLDDDWQSPFVNFENCVVHLKSFIHALDFCNSVLQMAPAVVCSKVLLLVRDGFLQQVLGPALFQVSEEAVSTAIGYLMIFMQHVSNVQLMREFLQFLTIGTCDGGKSVLNCLIQNMNSSTRKLSVASLELFNLLVDLNCEDFILEAILRHLLSGRHIMSNQWSIISETDMYSEAARRLLQLVPAVCTVAEQLYLDSLLMQASPMSSRTSSPSAMDQHRSSPSVSRPLSGSFHDSSSKPVNQNPSSSSSSFLDRPRRDSTSSTCSSSTTISSSSKGVPSSSTSSSAIPTSTSTNGTVMVGPPSAPLVQTSLSDVPENVFRFVPEGMGYLHYLLESRQAIEQCARACQCWSSSYDCCVVSEEEQREERLQVGVPPDTGIIVSVNGEVPTSLDFDAPEDILQMLSREEGRAPRKSLRGRRELSHQHRFTDQTGLLLKTLLHMVARLLENPPIVNLLLTQLIARLAIYPQPLLRSFLLNHQLVLRPGIPSLLQVLQTLNQTVDDIASEREGFERRLGRARKTMVFKAAVSDGLVDEHTASEIMQRARGSSCSSTTDLGEAGSHQNPSSTSPASQLPRRRASTEGSKTLQSYRRKRKRHKVTENTVYAITIFGEFIKELSAISQEHSALNPQLLSLNHM